MSLRAAKAFDSAVAWGERRAGGHQTGWHMRRGRGIMVLLGRRLLWPWTAYGLTQETRQK
jgi:hypothetical protein